MTKTASAAKGSIAGKSARKVAAVTAADKASKTKPAAKTKLTAEQADVIKVYKKANSNPASPLLMVQAADGRVATFDEGRLTKQLQGLVKVGASFAAVADYLAKHGKAAPALAKGVESRQNPHSSKAVADQRAASKPAAKSKAAPASAKLPPKSQLDGALVIKLTDKGAAKLKAGGNTGSIANLTLLSKSPTVAKALSNGLKGADISYAVKTGTITLG